MAEFTKEEEEEEEELEPLFDYSRVQPLDLVCLDDDDDSSPAFPSKRLKPSAVEEEPKKGEIVQIVECEDNEEEDWLPPPIKIPIDTKNRIEDSTIKALRLKKQELLTCAQSAEDLMRTFEESFKGGSRASLKSSSHTVAEPDSVAEPPPNPRERAKIIISIQDKDGLKQFRVYMDDKFERLFEKYADKVQLDMQNLAFCFDGDKISPTATPNSLGMEDDDIIEVHVKSS